MKKSEVCVKLTRKNCKKVLEILEMFGEPIGPVSGKELEDEIIDKFHTIALVGDTWCKCTIAPRRTYVKPRELRNILAKEHLKKGDVGVFGHTKSKYIAKFNNIKGGDIFNCYAYVYINSDRSYSETVISGGYFHDFLRYATDEEKALLEPNKEFGVDKFEEGVWYSSKYGALVNYGSGSRCYGWSIIGDWLEFETIARLSDYRKATEAEVIEALNKECVKRYGEDWETAKIEAHVTTDLGHVNTGIFDTIVLENVVWNTNGRLYSNGKWSELLKEPETYTREVWVNHYSDQEFHIHYNKEIAELHSRINNGFGKDVQTVKATLTYDIPMTKV